MKRLSARLLMWMAFWCFALLPATAQQVQHGKATYYAKRMHGTRTASGERLNMNDLVCAHRKHPFGTRLKVTNLVNGKSVIVRVVDRGPFGKGMVVDLSWQAAKELEMLRQGVVKCIVEVVK